MGDFEIGRLLSHHCTKYGDILPDFLNLVKLSLSLYRNSNKVFTTEVNDCLNYKALDVEHNRIRLVGKIVLDNLYLNEDKVVEISGFPERGSV